MFNDVLIIAMIAAIGLIAIVAIYFLYKYKIIRQEIYSLSIETERLSQKNDKFRDLIEELSGSTQFFINIFNQHPAKMYLVDKKNFKMLDANEAALKFYGYPKDEFLKMSLYDINDIPKEVLDLRIEETKDKGKSFFESKQILADGRKRDVEIQTAPIKISHDKEVLFSIINDVTIRKENENQLNKLYTAVYHSSSTIVITDTNGIIEYVNPKFEKITGYSSSEAIGEDPRLLNSGKNPDGFAEELWQTIQNGKEWSGELINRRKDGTFYWENASIAPVRDNQGKIVNYIKVAEDITEKKEAEEKLREREELYRFLTENSSDIMYKVSHVPEPHFEYISPSIEKFLGYPEKYFYGDIRFVEDLIHPEDKERVLTLLRNMEGEEFSNLVYRAITKDGRTMWFQFRNKINKNDTGEIIGYSGSGRDITKEKLAEIELVESEKNLRRREKELSELNATKDKFFSIISHDLKNPFSIFFNASELLKEYYYDMTDEDRLDRIKDIFDSSQYLYKLLENLLQWSRAQTGRLEHQPEELDIYEIAFNTTYLLKNSALKKDIRLSSTIKPETYIYADRNMLSTILRNLVSNAIKFTNNNGEIKIEGISKDSFIEISVSDTGIGIKEKDIDKLFRIDKTHSTKGTHDESGTGLGLILCKEFVEKNGGSIRVESTPDVGSVFSFTLPVSKES